MHYVSESCLKHVGHIQWLDIIFENIEQFCATELQEMALNAPGCMIAIQK